MVRTAESARRFKYSPSPWQPGSACRGGETTFRGDVCALSPRPSARRPASHAHGVGRRALSATTLSEIQTRMFSSLTAFLAPSVSPGTRFAWTSRGGRLAKHEMVEEGSPERAIDYWIGAHGQADELVDRCAQLRLLPPHSLMKTCCTANRLRALGVEVHDERWINACLAVNALVEAGPYRFSVLDQGDLDDRAFARASRRTEASPSTARHSPSVAAQTEAFKAPLMHVVPATPAGPANAGVPVTPTHRSPFLPFGSLQALGAIPEDSPLSRASARSGHSRTSTMDSDIAVEQYLRPPMRAGPGPQTTALPDPSVHPTSAPSGHPTSPAKQPDIALALDHFLAYEGSPSPQPACQPLHPSDELHKRLAEGLTAQSGPPTVPVDLVLAAASLSRAHDDFPGLDGHQQPGFQILKHAQHGFRVRRRSTSMREQANRPAPT